MVEVIISTIQQWLKYGGFILSTQLSTSLVEIDYFMDSISSKSTRQSYKFHLDRFIKKFYPDLNPAIDPKPLTQKIIQYLVHMKEKENISYSARNSAVAAIKHYCEMHDITLNWSKIRKFLGERTDSYSLRGYTREEIDKLLTVADLQYKAIILTYASTGMRREALVNLKLADMEYLKDHEIYKIRVYRKTDHEHITFTTPEAAAAINIYLNNSKMRNRIKDDFYFHRIKPKSITERLRNLAIEAGINSPGLESKKHKQGVHRNAIPCTHGLRKFAITQMAKAKVDAEIAKLLTDHTIGVRARYLNYTEDDLLKEYLKALDLLTINEENRLRLQVHQLKEREDQIMQLKLQMDKLQKDMLSINGRETRQ